MALTKYKLPISVMERVVDLLFLEPIGSMKPFLFEYISKVYSKKECFSNDQDFMKYCTSLNLNPESNLRISVNKKYEVTCNRLPESLKYKAVNYMFVELSDSQRNTLYDFMGKQFASLNVVVLYKSSESFAQLCNELGLDPGKREVIITENYTFTYSDDFRVPCKAAE